MCICGTSLIFFLPSSSYGSYTISFIHILGPWYARSGPYHLGHICWSYQYYRPHLPIRSYCAWNPRSYCFAPRMVHSSICFNLNNNNKLTGFLGLLRGAFSSNTSSNSVVPTSMGSLHFEFLGVSKWFLLSSSVSEWCFFLKVHGIFSITDSESNISFSFSREVLKYFTFSENEALQVLADLHGEGDKSNELVVLEYEQIRQQVKFSTTDKIFNG